jgi:hypothetical protein
VFQWAISPTSNCGTSLIFPRAFEFDVIAAVCATRSELDALFSPQAECVLQQ